MPVVATIGISAKLGDSMIEATQACDLLASSLPKSKLWSGKYLRLTAFFWVTLYLGCSPIFLYAAFEFSPLKATEYETEISGINRQDVFFKSENGSRLHGWYFKTAGASKTALLHHGQGGNVATYLNSAHALVTAGANVLLYDFEGFGLSEGEPNSGNVCKDAEAAYQYLLNSKGVQPHQIIEVGLSIGTGLACRMADKHPCAGVILISPYKSLECVAQRHLAFLRLYPSFLYPQPNLGAGNLFREKEIPLLMVHSVNDPLLPVAQADEIFRDARGPKTYIRVPLAPDAHLGGISDSAVVANFLHKLPRSVQNGNKQPSL